MKEQIRISGVDRCVTTMEPLQKLHKEKRYAWKDVLIVPSNEVMQRPMVLLSVGNKEGDFIDSAMVDVVTGTIYDKSTGKCWSSDQMRMVV